MIDRASITNWSVSHPWGQKSFVEQDLVISRVLVSIYSDPFLSEALAFRGGTALHKLYLAPQVRYSEDIDLVQVESGPIKPIVERLDAVLAWLPGKAFDLRRFGFRMRFRYDSELPPSVPMRLKVEVNTYEHFSELGFVKMPFTVENAWFSGSCEIKTYALEETLPAEEGARPLRYGLRHETGGSRHRCRTSLLEAVHHAWRQDGAHDERVSGEHGREAGVA